MSDDSSNTPDAVEVAEPKARITKGDRIAGAVTAVTSGALLYLLPPLLAALFALPPVLALLSLSGIFSADVMAEKSYEQFWYVLLVEIIVIAVLVLLLRAARETWRSIGVAVRGNKIGTYLFVGFFVYYVLYIAAAIIASIFVPSEVFEQRQELGFDEGISGLGLVFAFISLVVLPPIVEEIVFRGFLYTRLKRFLPMIASAVIVSILFAIAHLQFGTGNSLLWIAALDTFILSMVLVWMREKTGSIWAGVGLHAIKNGLAFYLLFVSPLLR